MNKYCLGIDVGGTTTKMGLFTCEGELIDKWEIRTAIENEGNDILTNAAKSIESQMINKNLDRSEIAGIGIGVPGPVNDEGVILESANLRWGKRNVKAEMMELTRLPVCVGNDANMAALGEIWRGGGKGYRSIVMITLGTGVGGGLIVNGEIFTGANGGGGEIGHISVARQNGDFDDTGSGMLEDYASATGIVKLAKQKLKKYPDDYNLNTGTLTAKRVFDEAKENNPVAIETIKEFGKYLGDALAAIAAIVDPEAFVIGGGVSRAGDILLDCICPPFKEKVHRINKDIDFRLATLGNDAGIYGAAKLVLDH